MLVTREKKAVIGDCEASHFDGKGINVQITQVGSNPQTAMWLCAECLLKEQKAEEASVRTVVQSRKVDTLLELKQDVFVAGTVAFADIQAMILNDASIPDDKKWKAIVQETDRRIHTLNAAIFEEEKVTNEKKNLRQALHVNIQQVMNKLSKEEREKYKQYDVNYVVGKPGKAEKTVKPVKPAKKQPYNKKLATEVAEKYGVPFMQVVGFSVANDITYVEAAHMYLKMMGLPIPV